MAQTIQIEIDDKSLDYLQKIQAKMNAPSLAEAIRRAIQVGEAIHTLEEERYTVIARSSHEGVADKRVEITYHPKFGIRLVLAR